MKSQRPPFSVIEGRPDAPVRIALSLVHRRERIDIPVRDVLEIEVLGEETFYFPEIRASKSYPFAHVKVTLKPDVRARLHRLTRAIVGEPLEIVVGGEAICWGGSFPTFESCRRVGQIRTVGRISEAHCAILWGFASGRRNKAIAPYGLRARP
jgi:hypothetical protein